MEVKNGTTIVFNAEFKNMIRILKNEPVVKKLKYCWKTGANSLKEIMEIQDEIRTLIPKKFIKKPYPDYYSCMIMILIDIEKCESWKDVNNQLNSFILKEVYVGDLRDIYNKKITCMCSYKNCLSQYSVILSNESYDIMLGSHCITKCEIFTEKIKIYMKKRKAELKKIKKEIEHNEMINSRPYCKYCKQFYTGSGDMCMYTDDICFWI
jgi:hypothetical protein